MRGKLLNKVIAGAITIAMAAQFAVVLPMTANAATYSTQDFSLPGSTSSWVVGGGKGALKTDSTQASIGQYYEHNQDGGGGNRSASYAFPTEAQDAAKSVLEFNFKQKPGTDRNGQLAIMGKGVAMPAVNSTADAGYIFKFDIPANSGDITINNTYKTVTTPKETWLKVKTVFDFTEHSAIIMVTSLDGNTTYFQNKINIDSKITGLGYIWSLVPRSNGYNSFDNITVRDYEENDAPTYHSVSYTGGLEDVSEYVLNDATPANVPENPIKKGPYRFTGNWYKGDDKLNQYSTARVKEMQITENTVFTAIFVEEPSNIEKLESMTIKTHPVMKPELPTAQNDTVVYPVELEVLGSWGSDLLDPSYEYAKGDMTVTWDIVGLDILNGQSTNEPVTTEDGNLVYGDSYITLAGFKDNATSGTITVRNGVGNYFAKLKVTVKYGNEDAGYIEKTDSFPMIIMPDTNQIANRIYPLGGYPSNLNWYADGLVGHKVTDFNNNKNVPDDFLSGWCTWGGRSTKAMYLQQETNGDKYLFATGGSDTSSSVYCANNFGAVNEQVYVDLDVSFSASGEAIQLIDVNGKRKDYTGSLPTSAFSAVHTTPYRNSIHFDGSALKFGEGIVAGVSPDKWYRVRISYDDSVQKLWYQVYNIAEDGSTGTLVGKTDELPYNTADTREPLSLSYFVLAPSATPDKGIKVKNMTAYKPSMTEFEIVSDSDTISIPKDVDTQFSVLEETKYAVTGSLQNNTVTLNIENKNSSQSILTAYVAGYDKNNNLIEVKTGKSTIEAGATSPVTIAASTNQAVTQNKLFIWDANQQPIINTTILEEKVLVSKVDLTSLMKDAEGNRLSGTVEWSLAETYDGVTITQDPTDSTKAELAVGVTAGSGDIVIKAANRGQIAQRTLKLTGSDDNIAFTNPTTSITIPFEGDPAKVVYTAQVRNGEGNVIPEKTITYDMYDKTNSAVLENTAEVSFNSATGELSVTKDARGQIVHIRATSTNTEGDEISKTVKVIIRGLAFDFGASDMEGVEDGYTPVTPKTNYSDATGYGIVASGVVAGGSSESNILDGDYLEAPSLTFKAKVPAGKNYKVTVTYKGQMTAEYVDEYCTGVKKGDNLAALTNVTHNVAVLDDVLDITVANGQIASVVIERIPDKVAGEKPTWFTYGDSTTNSSSDGKVGWANRAQQFTTKFNVSNTAKSGSNATTYYTEKYMDNILLNVAPGDLVTFNGMGTNSYSSKFEEQLHVWIKACQDRGAYVIMTTYTPHGPVAGSNWANGYNSTTQTFDCDRDNDGYTAIYRRVAADTGLTLIDFGKIANDLYNNMVNEASADDTTIREAKAQEIIACYLDHNHYNDKMATMLAEAYAPVVESEFNKLIAPKN